MSDTSSPYSRRDTGSNLGSDVDAMIQMRKLEHVRLEISVLEPRLELNCLFESDSYLLVYHPSSISCCLRKRATRTLPMTL